MSVSHEWSTGCATDVRQESFPPPQMSLELTLWSAGWSSSIAADVETP
jgi:hypothetical protein